MNTDSSRIGQLSRLLLALVVVTASLGVVAGSATAQSDQPQWAVETFDRMEDWVPTYNQQVSGEDFGVAASQLKNERVNLIVTDANGETGTASFRTDSDLRIQEFSMGTRDDATIQMTTDRATINGILDSPSPANAFVNAIANGDVTISGLGTVAQVKWVVINTIADLARAFGL